MSRLTRPHHRIRPTGGLWAQVRARFRRGAYRTTGWPLVTSPGLTAVIVLIVAALAANLAFGG